MQPDSFASKNKRLGFHYFPDASHYRDVDLHIWIPRLESLGARWLTLLAPLHRAVPEFFLTALIDAQIEPLLHFPISLDRPGEPESFRMFFRNYARWGVRYVALFDRPNSRCGWSPASWAQPDLVERFLDKFIPLADVARQEGLTPVFPPLEPGGDYWDTSFLRASLASLKRRKQTHLLDALHLGAYAWANNRPLNWGAGGPERWPGTRPYVTPKDGQDQLGFHIFDWYQAIAQAELGRPLPILLLRAGSRIGDCADPLRPSIDRDAHAERNLVLANLFSEEKKIISSEVLACNFWLLAASPDSAHAAQAWFQPDGRALPAATLLQQLVGNSAGCTINAENRLPARHLAQLLQQDYRQG